MPWLSWTVGVVLTVHSLYLMSQGLFNFGIALPLLAGLGLALLGWRWQAVQRWLHARVARQRAWRWCWRLAALWLATVVVFWGVLWRAGAGQPLPAPPAAIVVLGSGTPGGKPSPMLAARLDTALAQAARYPQALVLVSGGVDFGGTLSEGQIMGDYLRTRGLSATRIVQEERSASTEENLRFALPLLAGRGVTPQLPVLIVTSDFHTLRSRWLAEGIGYEQVGSMGAPTPLYMRCNAWLREYFSVIKGWLLRQF
ncbi:MAG: YdcF family protein [Azonexus sp.]|jgi:uncharacterized SAM-binding protein YcdF (DUF218 family)|nr:YdcF family protein [Azonexus sp.]